MWAFILDLMSLLSHRLFGPEAPDRQPYRPNSSFITWTISEDGTDFNIASMAHSHFYLGHYLGHSLQPARRFFEKMMGPEFSNRHEGMIIRGDRLLRIRARLILVIGLPVSRMRRRNGVESACEPIGLDHAHCRMDGQWEAIQNHDADLRFVGLPRLPRESQMDPGHFQLPREVSA
jgi:hypothetical protein